ncbi:unnamed protein product [Lathyrus sativus]|nr:unnamed protein product [Lathyrus sativus]
MKHVINVRIIVLWAYAYPCLSRMLDESSVVKAHQEWMIKYGITYTNSSEMEKRLQIFQREFRKNTEV